MKAPCARCGTEIECWPYRVGKAVCRACLHAIRIENGQRVGAAQQPEIGTVRVVDVRGIKYRQVYRPDHGNAPKGGWKMEHRIVMENHMQGPLHSSEVVHHINHDSLDNRIENLRYYKTKGEHLAVEHSADGVKARMAGYPSCEKCGKRTAYGETLCWACWKQSQTCPKCGRPDRKMATRAMCHGCYKRHRARPVSGSASNPNSDG